MAKRADELSKRVAATANRLRLIQVDFADEDSQTRMGYLADAIEHALGDLSPEQRQPFLNKLMEQFPTWDANVEVVMRPAEAEGRSETDRRELQDPSFLLTRLAEVLPSLSDAEKQAVTGRLREMGIAPQTTGGLPEQPVERIKDALALKKDEEPDPNKVIDLIAPLLVFAAKLDPLVRRTWGNVAPKSRLHNPTNLPYTLKRFVTGDPTVNREHIELIIEQLRQLLAAMVFALGQPGKFAASYLIRFSPEKIQDLVKMDGGKWFVSNDVRCWEKYRELATQFLNEAEIEKGLRERITTFIESLVLQKPH